MSPFFFIQLADPQFGMFAARSKLTDEGIEKELLKGCKVIPTGPISGLDKERQLFAQAIGEANRLRPAFVVVCGDMVHTNSPSEWKELLEVAGTLDPSIPIHWVPGNHDIGGLSTKEAMDSLYSYREMFEANYSAFQHQEASFIILDSTAICNKPPLPDEWDAQLAFVEKELAAAASRGGPTIVFSHHPAFLKSPDEPDDYWNMPLRYRVPLLQRLRTANVKAMFCGHWHRNNYTSYSDMEVVVSGPVGYPLAKDPSGYRIVKVNSENIEHEYYGFGAGPSSVLDLVNSTQLSIHVDNV